MVVTIFLRAKRNHGKTHWAWLMKKRPIQKINLFVYFIGSIFFVLIARLYYLQIIRGEDFSARSESNFIQERIVKHRRGRIIDYEGTLLADNRLAYDVYVTFAMLPDRTKNIKTLFA